MLEETSPLYCLLSTRGLRGGLHYVRVVSFECPSATARLDLGITCITVFWAGSESAGLAPGTRLSGLEFRQRAEKGDRNALTGLQPQEGSRSVRSTTGARPPRPARYFRSCLRQRNKPSTRQIVRRQVSQASYSIFVIPYHFSEL